MYVLCSSVKLITRPRGLRAIIAKTSCGIAYFCESTCLKAGRGFDVSPRKKTHVSRCGTYVYYFNDKPEPNVYVILHVYVVPTRVYNTRMSLLWIRVYCVVGERTISRGRPQNAAAATWFAKRATGTMEHVQGASRGPDAMIFYDFSTCGWNVSFVVVWSSREMSKQRPKTFCRRHVVRR